MNVNSIKNFIATNFSPANTSSMFSAINQKTTTIALLCICGLYLTFCTVRYSYYNWKKIEDGQNKTIDFWGCVYEGEFKNGKLNGQGTLKRGMGCYDEGEFEDGRLHGQGTRVYLSAVAKGEFKHGKLNGQAKIEINFPLVETEEGEFLDDELNGNGKRTLELFGKVVKESEGEFHKGLLDGKGKSKHPIYGLQDGTFEKGKFIG